MRPHEKFLNALIAKIMKKKMFKVKDKKFAYQKKKDLKCSKVICTEKKLDSLRSRKYFLCL